MMRQLTYAFFLLWSVLTVISCKKENTPDQDNPDVQSVQIDTTLKSYYINSSPDTTSEIIYKYDFGTIGSPLSINMYWAGPADVHGIYLHFDSWAGDVLMDNNGFIKGFNSGVTIDSTLSGTWNGATNPVFSYDYVLYPSANKGNLAGQGDKYIVFRTYTNLLPQLKYYGWLRVRVSDNGRDMKVISIGYQKNPNKSLFTGEL